MQIPVDELPDVAPRPAPTPVFSQQASGADFGAQAGQAWQQAGDRATAASTQWYDFASQRQANANELWANDANTQAMQQVAAHYGQFNALEGQAAVAALPQFQKDIQNTVQQALDNAPSDQARDMLSRSLRWIGDSYLRYGQSYADAQQRKWADDSLTASAATKANQAALAVNQPDAQIVPFIQSGAHDIASLYGPRYIANFSALSPDQQQAAIAANPAIGAKMADYQGAAWLSLIKLAAANGDLQRADGFLANHRDEMDSGSVLAAEQALKAQNIQFAAQGAGNQILGRMGVAVTPAGAQFQNAAAAPLSVDQMAAAIHGQESGGAATAPTSPDGAAGGWQITPATFQHYAQPGESLDNPADNQRVGQRIIADLWQKTGGDPARVAVGYFSGPGNIAPPGSPTPWIKDTTDSTGKSVSAYVGDVSGRLAKAGVLLTKAQALSEVDAQYGNNPQMAHAVRSYVNQQYTVANLTAQAQVQATKVAQDAAYDEYIKAAMSPGTDAAALVAKLATDPRFDGAGATREHLFDAIQSHGQGKAYGQAFYPLLQAVHSDGPDRITDPAQLLPKVNGQDLTLEGFDKLRGEISGQGTPQGAAEGQMVKGALAYLKHQISFAQDFGTVKIPDPQGEDLFNVGAVPAFYKAYEEGRNAGKTPYQLLSQDSPDWIVGKIATAYKRSPAQIAADRMNTANALSQAPGASAPNGAPSPFDLSTPQGVAAAYHAGRIPYDQARRTLIQLGVPTAAAPTAPIGP